MRTWCVRACLSHRRRDRRTGGSPPSPRCWKRARTRGDAFGTAAECRVVEPSRRPNAAFSSETAGRKRPDRFWCRSPPRDDLAGLPLTVRSRGVEGPIHEPRGRVRGTKGTLARDANSHAIVLTGRHRDAGRGGGILAGCQRWAPRAPSPRRRPSQRPPRSARRIRSPRWTDRCSVSRLRKGN